MTLHQFAVLNPSNVRGFTFEIGPVQFRFFDTEVAALLNRGMSITAT